MKPLPLPPQDLRFMQEDDAAFITIGDGLVAKLKTIAGLHSETSIIDIGSGYGRLAHALLRGDFKGQYHGFDILKRHVTWCQANLSTDHVSFGYLDIYNSRYNPAGSVKAHDIKLENYVNRSDLVVLTSVFTHMLPDEIENYVSCFPTLLLPDGRVCATFFLITDQRRGLIDENKSKLSLPFKLTPYARYHNADDPLHAIAFEEQWVRDVLHQNGMTIRQIDYGYWCGQQQTNSALYQDFVVFSPN
ncbi:MAG: class I SAM-dependent methyltransferase [Elainellaceae cyanobacterium]